MKILAIDTATEACSVALYNAQGAFQDNANSEADSDSCIDSIFEICPQAHSQQLLPMIDKIMSRNNLDIDDLDALAYGRGPGSFTGVRIAASTVQGLALGADLPVLQISTLAAMAQQNFAVNGLQSTAVLIDARMQEVYCSVYKIIEGIAKEQIEESVLLPEKAKALIDNVQNTHQSFGYAGTGFVTYADVFTEIMSVPGESDHDAPEHKLQNKQNYVNYPNAKYMIPLALAELANNKSVKAQDIKPVYVRDTVTWQKLPHKQ
jgi:tRNA threonylcarbamoyladenosine biosynthesis protein TsaB